MRNDFIIQNNKIVIGTAWPHRPSRTMKTPVRLESNLTDRVAATLHEEITSSEVSPGDVLPPEAVIAERMGVSRTVLREAVSRLKVEGLVSSKQGVGLVVLDNRKFSVLKMHAVVEHDVEEAMRIVELRLGFEIEAAGFAAMRRNESDLQEMRSALDEMRAALERGAVSNGVDADFRFHRAIANATRNANYSKFFGFLSELYRHNLLVSRGRSAKISPRGNQAQQEHEAIYQAILAKDVVAARQAARTHVENTAHRLRDTGGLLDGVRRNKDTKAASAEAATPRRAAVKNPKRNSSLLP